MPLDILVLALLVHVPKEKQLFCPFMHTAWTAHSYAVPRRADHFQASDVQGRCASSRKAKTQGILSDLGAARDGRHWASEP